MCTRLVVAPSALCQQPLPLPTLEKPACRRGGGGGGGGETSRAGMMGELFSDACGGAGIE